MGISVKHISKYFGKYCAVDNVSFDVEEGELVALLGPSGSGKSTILRIISGLETADTGEVFITGRNVTSLTAQQRKVGFVFQHYALFKHMTVEKNIAFGLEIQKRGKEEITEKVHELINLVKLQGYEKHYPAQLSGGQRQRVALARTLATEPAVLLLDEPFGALDSKVRQNLATWLKELHAKLNITSLFVTHDQSEAIEISDKIVIINRGKVEQEGSAHDVYEHPGSKFVASFIGHVNVIDAFIKDNSIVIKDTDCAIEYKNYDISDGSDIILLVRPEDVIMQHAESQHALPCRINQIHYRGSFYEIDLGLGTLNIKLIENKNSFSKEKWKENQQAFIQFKKYKVFETTEGHGIIREQLRQLGYIE
ncbi:MAG: sulfate ABC transporter ATP-binding protein [Proteobacteria bacterium]|nr:sulfate ABC transporter ATP-binding protein [Pseudomonadota bacterium]